MTTSIVRGRYVVCRAVDRYGAEIVENGAVLQTDGVVAAIGDFAELSRRHPDAPVIGSQDHVVLPGFVNGHHHVGLTPLQLGSPDHPLELWFASRMAARDVDPYLDTLYSAFEMIESGITTVQHLHGRVPGPIDNVFKGASEVIRAYQAVGMRVSYAYMLRDQNRLVYEADEDFARRLPPDLAAEVLEAIRRPAIPLLDNAHLLKSLTDRFEDDPRVAVQLAPANLHWCSDAALELISELVDRHRVPFHMHLLETQYQKEYARRRGDATAVTYLDRIGLLGPLCTLGHGVWMTEADIELVAERGACICHNCSSNLRLRSGVAPLNAWERRGVRVAIGIDEAGINDDRDMLQEMRMVLRQHRVPGLDPDEVPTPAQVFRMATEDGAMTTPFGATIGAIAPGRSADLVLIDWRQVARPYLDPDTGVLEAIVQRAKTTGVDTVMVAGEVVYRDRTFTRIDKEAVLAELSERLSRPRSPAEERRREMARRVFPHVRAFYEDYVREGRYEPYYRPSSRA